MTTRLSLRIQDYFNRLSRQERRLARLLLEQEDDVLAYAAAELAVAAGVSKSTVTRFFRRLGYTDFAEVRVQAREERNRGAPAAQQRSPLAGPPPVDDLDSYLRREMENLVGSLEAIRSDLLAQAAGLIATAPAVWILGMHAESGLARHIVLMLTRHRGSVRLLAPGEGGLAEELAMVGPGDAVLVVSAQPQPKQLDNIIGFLATTRARLVHLTDSSGLGSGRHGALVFICRTASHFLQPSRSAFLAVAQVLVAAVAKQLGVQAARRAELIDKIHDELGDYQVE